MPDNPRIAEAIANIDAILERAHKPVGERIREMRKAAGLSQNGLARTSGITVTTISRTETALTVPNLDTLEALAHGLGINVEQLLAPAAE